MRLVDIDLLLNEMNNEKTKYTCQIDLKQKESKSVIIDKTLKAYRGLIFDMIKDLPTIEIPQWIPIEERLPTKEEYCRNDGRFIVSDGMKSYECTFDVYDGKFKAFEYNRKVICTEYVDEKVVAWMELPQPYKKGTQ